MDNSLKLQKYSDKLFTSYKVKIMPKDRYKIVKQVALHLDTMIFNIVALFCLIAIVNNTTKVTEQTLDAGRKYIEKGCSKMSGGKKGWSGGDGRCKLLSGGDGRMGTAAFVGVPEPMYSTSNPSSDVLFVNFEAGEARPQIGGATVKDDLSKIIDKYVKDVLSYHRVTASKNVKDSIAKMVHFHVQCFLNAILKHKGSITTTVLEKMMKKHKVLHPV